MIKSLLQGFGSLPPPFKSVSDKDVMAAIGDDFKAVGRDIQSAIEQFDESAEE